jgi:hypothetical protein
MPPRINPIRETVEFKDFIARLYSDLNRPFDEDSKAAQEVPRAQKVVAAARRQFRDDDDAMVTDAVLRAQAHHMAALFIRRARKAAGFTSQQLADRMGVRISVLSDYQSFRNTGKVPLDFLLRVAYHCGGDLRLSLDRDVPKDNARRRE